ncbi:MAG: hypothetical protein RL017_203 [Pseudomonadota bacterium]|jgi:TldD protein|nr:metalloprotease TldD [Burkholderiales bacterium]
MQLKQVEQSILVPNELDFNFLQQMLQKLSNKKVDFCDLYLQVTASETFSLDEGIIKGGGFGIDQGIGIRAICGEKTFLSYSNSLGAKTISSLVENIFIEPVQQIKSQPPLVTKAEHLLYSANSPIKANTSIEKIELLNKINAFARAMPYVQNVISSLSIEYDQVCIVSSKNGQIADIRPLVHLSATVVINKDGKNEKGYGGVGGRYLISEFTDAVIKKLVLDSYDQALLKTEAVAGPSGQMPVVLGNAWAGVILHEAVGHGLEGDFNRKGSSAFSNKIGQKVASDGVTIVDEGCIANRRGSLNVDDEGNATQRTVLIENGILRGYMFDELNANLMGTKSTGNGRRESFNCIPMPRMTNTYMLNGQYTHDEIIASIDNGLYAENFSGGQVDITSGQFVFNANVAWVIKNGKLSYPVKGCALVGNGPECLKYVSMIGNNSQLDSGVGTCGKSGQNIPVGVGQPTIRVDSGLVVGGGT